MLLHPFQENQKLILGLNIGKNQHFPTLNDLYWQPGGNSNLKNENGYFIDCFINSFINKKSYNFELLISPFASIINNWIIWQPSEFHYWTAQNIKKVFSRGVELNIKILKKGKITHKFTANHAFTLSTDRNLSKQLIYVPKNTGFIFYQMIFRKFSYHFSINFTDKRFTNSSNNSFILPAFWLLNSSISKSFNIKKIKFNLEFNVNNILNFQYQSILYRPMPGRNYGLKISGNF